MRRFKFRAWDIESKFMIDWDEIQEPWESEGYFPGIFNNDHHHCMQFTGLRDKNGVEIYEGDIVKGVMSRENKVVEVRFYDKDIGSCGCCYTEFSGSGFAAIGLNLGDDVEIIGNIHQNPELLK